MNGKAAKKRKRTPKAKAVYSERKKTTGCLESAGGFAGAGCEDLGGEHVQWTEETDDDCALHCCSAFAAGRFGV